MPSKVRRWFAEESGRRTSRTCIKVNQQRLRLAPKGHGAVILEIVDTVGFVLEGIDGGVRSSGSHSNRGRELACRGLG